MKVFSIILAVIVASFSVLPCSDDMTSENCGTEIHFHAGSSDHDDHSNTDLCSPFCNCCCCHTHVTPQAHESLIAAIPVSDIDFNYSEGFISSTDFFIWHPPKV